MNKLGRSTIEQVVDPICVRQMTDPTMLIALCGLGYSEGGGGRIPLSDHSPR